MENTWQQNIRESFRSAKELSAFLNIPLEEISPYPLFIPRKIAEQIKKEGPSGALYKQFVPSLIESKSTIQKLGLIDPIGDKTRSQGSGIIHRYSNRILFTPTVVCPINCRYCFRKNELGTETLFNANLEKLTEYLILHPDVNEVILTGGDPLMLSDQKLQKCFEKITEINTVKYLRIHTRFPVIVPERITSGFKNLIMTYSQKIKIIMAIHTNHFSEISSTVTTSLQELSMLPITLLSQTVLLKNVNDHSQSLIDLFLKLDEFNIRPYYLHHPDKVLGAMHFYLSLEAGRKIYGQLRDKLPGWLIPHYVIDGPEGRGKTQAFNPETFTFSGQLIDKDGALYQTEI